MVAVHKISKDLYEDSFTLIALHCSLEDFAMVYTINQYLKSNFKRLPNDLDISENVSFPYFEWNDETHDRYWALMANYSVQKKYVDNNDLFKDEPTLTAYHLVPEYKDVDYFLKIDQEDVEGIEETVKKLLTIPQVLMAYEVKTSKLKSKTNLIF